MSEHQILTNRTINCIDNLKFKLKEIEQTDLYNDLLILRHIVPSLPSDTIRCLLLELKPHSSNDSPFVNHNINFQKINIILSRVKRPCQLLTDFLACAGVAPVETA